MGEVADSAYDDMLLAEIEKEHYISNIFENYNKSLKIWQTRSGKDLSIQEMSDSHLSNSLDMILRSKSSDYKDVTVRILKTEISRRENNYYDIVKSCPNCNHQNFDGNCNDC